MATQNARFVERYSLSLGTAIVKLDNLKSENTPGAPLLDNKNISRLQRIFELEGCQRLEPDNFVPVIVDVGRFSEAIAISSITEAELKDPRKLPQLQFAEDFEGFTVLHGRHRLHAARQHLRGEDRWWTIEIFSKDLPETTVVRLTDHFSNEFRLSDGEVYRCLRQCQLADVDAGKWLARLSPVKRRDVQQLHRKEPELTAAFDALLPFHGLWASVELGTLHRVLTLRCSTEMARYLQIISMQWYFVIGDTESGTLIDAYTVQELETLHPFASFDDRRRIEQLMAKRKIFPFVTNLVQRNNILHRLKMLQTSIFSLHTFLEDTKHLELMTKPLRNLLPEKPRDQLVECFRNIFTVSMRALVQKSESISGVEAAHTRYDSDVFYLHYLQLVLFCMRHFHALLGVAPRKDKGRRNLTPIVSPITTNALARLAYQLGFRSDQIEELSSAHAEEDATISFLRSLRPTDTYYYSDNQHAELARNVTQAISSAMPRSGEAQKRPHYTTDSGELIKCHRIGRPYARSYQTDQRHIFVDNFYRSFEWEPAEFLTSLGAKRECFVAFFGTLAEFTPPVLLSMSPNDLTPSSPLGLLNSTRHDPSLELAETLPTTSTQPVALPMYSPSIYSTSSRPLTQIGQALPTDTVEFIRQAHQSYQAGTSKEVMIINFIGGSDYHYTPLASVINFLFDVLNIRTVSLATLQTSESIERQNARSIEEAAGRDGIVFLYLTRRTVVYPQTDLEGFITNITNT